MAIKLEAREEVKTLQKDKILTGLCNQVDVQSQGEEVGEAKFLRVLVISCCRNNIYYLTFPVAHECIIIYLGPLLHSLAQTKIKGTVDWTHLKAFQEKDGLPWLLSRCNVSKAVGLRAPPPY